MTDQDETGSAGDVTEPVDGDLEVPGTGVQGDDATAGIKPVTSRRPVSATSRARRIGGSAVRPSARPEADDEANETVERDDAAGHDSAGTPVIKVRPANRRKPGKTARETSSRGSDDASSRGSDRVAVLRWLPAVVLSALALAMAVVLAVAVFGGSWSRPSSNSVRDKVLTAAKTCLVATNTYKYTNLDAFEKTGLACASSTFATQFKQSVDKLLRKAAPTVKQTQTFQVNSAGIVDVTAKNEWDVLIYGQVSVVNISTKGRIDPYGALARMKQVKGRWKIVSLDTLCSTALLTSGNKCS